MPALAAPPAYLTAAEACAVLRLSRRTLSDRVARGALPFVHRGGRLLFPVAWLDAWRDGAELERVALTDGGVVVRPIGGDDEP